MRQSILGMLLGWILLIFGCNEALTPSAASGLQFTVEEVFYIKPPVDRVILVGTISEGMVKVGDVLQVHCEAGPIEVIVEGIELFKAGETQQAIAGQQVGLKLAGLRHDQASKGDIVTSPVDKSS